MKTIKKLSSQKISSRYIYNEVPTTDETVSVMALNKEMKKLENNNPDNKIKDTQKKVQKRTENILHHPDEGKCF